MPRNWIRRWSSLLALVVLAGLLGAVVGGITVRAAPQQQAAVLYHVVISEFRLQGPNGVDDEFIEIFNPTGDVLNISNYEIWGSTSAGGTGNVPRYIFPSNTFLQAGQHYLIANPGTVPSPGYSGVVTPDGTFSSGIPSDGGLAITLPGGGASVDQVGLSAGSAYQEGTILTPLVTDVDRGYERGISGGTSNGCSDTDDNGNDFYLLAPDGPQNMSSPLTVCPNAATATATSSPTATDTATNTPLATSTFTATNTFTPTLTKTPTLTFTPVAPPHIVISEFRSNGPLGAGDEFVEVFNATGATTNIGGWSIKRSSSCGTSISFLFIFPPSAILAPGQHYLAAATGSTYATTADWTFSSGIADTGGIALVTSTGTVVDAAGMCITTTYREGIPLDPLSGTTNQSYERRPGGAVGGCYDLDNNFTDFVRISPASPLKSTSAKSMCSGVVLASPTSTATPTRTSTPTRGPTSIPGIIVINEILPHPSSDWNGDGVVNYNDEYIELVNAGQEEYTIKNWTLTDGSGIPVYTIPSITMLPQQILVLFHSQTGISLSDGGDEVVLYRNSGAINDAWTFPVVESADRTWCRLPDGRGTWSFGCWPSPGKPNTLSGMSAPPPVEESTCPLADVVPSIIKNAECGSSGDSIWGSSFWKNNEFWLKTHDKDVFVE